MKITNPFPKDPTEWMAKSRRRRALEQQLREARTMAEIVEAKRALGQLEAPELEK